MDKKDTSAAPSSTGDAPPAEPTNATGNPALLQNVQQRLELMGEDLGALFAGRYADTNKQIGLVRLFSSAPSPNRRTGFSFPPPSVLLSLPLRSAKRLIDRRQNARRTQNREINPSASLFFRPASVRVARFRSHRQHCASALVLIPPIPLCPVMSNTESVDDNHSYVSDDDEPQHTSPAKEYEYYEHV